jgi:hypothetical protein
MVLEQGLKAGLKALKNSDAELFVCNSATPEPRQDIGFV